MCSEIGLYDSIEENAPIINLLKGERFFRLKQPILLSNF